MKKKGTTKDTKDFKIRGSSVFTSFINMEFDHRRSRRPYVSLTLTDRVEFNVVSCRSSEDEEGSV